MENQCADVARRSIRRCNTMNDFSLGNYVQALYERYLDDLWEASQRRYPKKYPINHRPGTRRKVKREPRLFTCWSCGNEREDTTDNCHHCNAVDFPF